MSIVPDPYKSMVQPHKLFSVAALSLFGLIANLLALELPLTTPLLLGNLAFIVILQRHGLWWGLASAILVLFPLDSPLYWLCSLLQLLTVLLFSRVTRRKWLLLLLYFLCCLLVLFWFPVQKQPFIAVLLSALILTSTLMILQHFARLFIFQSASQQTKRQQPLQKQLGSRIAIMAAIPWSLMISALLHGSVVLNLSGYVNELAMQQQQIESQLKQKLMSYQAELRLASSYASLVGDEQSLQQLVYSQPEFISALRTDAAGIVRSFFKEQAAQDIAGHSVAHRDYFIEPQRTGQAYISDVFQGQRLGTDLLFALSLPLFQEQQFAGVLELSVALERLTTALKPRYQDNHLQVILMDGQQIKIWGYAAPQLPGQKMALDHASVAKSKAYLTQSPFHSPGELYFNQQGNKIRLESQIEGTNWPLLLLWDYSHLALFYQLLTLAALLLMLAGFELLSRSSRRFASGYTGALQQLMNAIESMQLHSVEPAKLVLKNSALEFEHLLASFTSLQQRLQSGHKALQSALEEKTNLSQQLEQRVTERTAELSIERDKAQQLASTKTRFLANMSHELRTPLTVILGFIQQIMTKPHDSLLQSQLQTIDSQSKFLLQIVNDILDAAKMDEGKLPLELLDFELQQLLNELHQSLLPAAQAKALNFCLDIKYPLPRTLHSDPLRLKQILMNLLSNALKFTQQGEVRLSATIAQNQLHLVISDTGPGISSEMQQKLFAAFEQGDPGVSRQFGGTGLGLYICKQLADLLGYQLTLHSTLEQGTQFTLAIPLTVHTELLLKAPLQSTRNSMQAQQQLPTFVGKVLIVDDVPDLRLLFSTLLKSTGLEIQTALNGLDAIQKVTLETFDLILMDMHMPVMDGLTATLELRRLGYQIPIIALTADVQAEQKRLCLQAGCQTVLTKPVQAEHLYSKIAEFLPVKQSEKAETAVQQQLDELTAMYRESLPSVALDLEKLMQVEDPVPTAALLHRIKGTSACFGFNRISSLAAAAERALAENNWPLEQLKELLIAIQQENP